MLACHIILRIALCIYICACDMSFYNVCGIADIRLVSLKYIFLNFIRMFQNFGLCEGYFSTHSVHFDSQNNRHSFWTPKVQIPVIADETLYIFVDFVNGDSLSACCTQRALSSANR